MPKVRQSTNHFVSTRTRPGEIIHIISVGVRGGGGGGRNECVRLVCQASGTREKLGAGIKQRAGIASCPEFRAAGNLKGLGTPGWRQGADDQGQARRGGRQPPGAARVARAVRQIPQGGRRQSPGAPGPAPATWHPAAAAATPPGARLGQPAARSRPSLPRGPPPPGRSEGPGEGAGGRREASVTAAAERRQEVDPAAS